MHNKYWLVFWWTSYNYVLTKRKERTSLPEAARRKMTKTSTDKKISVIYMRLPKRLASSNDFLNTIVTSVFLFLSKFELLVHATRMRKINQRKSIWNLCLADRTFVPLIWSEIVFSSIDRRKVSLFFTSF